MGDWNPSDTAMAAAWEAFAVSEHGTDDYRVAVEAAVLAAAPAIVASELRRLAEQFDLDGRVAGDRVSDHVIAGNGTGATIATVTSEIYETVAEHLRARADELDPDGAR